VPRPDQSPYAIAEFSATAKGFIGGFKTKGYKLIKGFMGISAADYNAKEKLPEDKLQEKKLKVFHSLLVCGTAAICLLDEAPDKIRRNEFAGRFYRELFLLAGKTPGTKTACRQALMDFLDYYAPPVVVRAIQTKVKQGDDAILTSTIGQWGHTTLIVGAPSQGFPPPSPNWLAFLRKFCTGSAASFLAKVNGSGAEEVAMTSRRRSSSSRSAPLSLILSKAWTSPTTTTNSAKVSMPSTKNSSSRTGRRPSPGFLSAALPQSCG
jgi:hypothetical protein